MVNISDEGWTVAYNGTALDELLKLDFVMKSIGPTSAPTDLTLTAEGQQGLFDWLSTEGVAHVEAIKTQMLTRLSEDQTQVQDWFATGGGHDALVKLDSEIDLMESEMLQALSSAQAKLGRAKQALSKAHNSAEAISTTIAQESASLQSCSWTDVACNVKNAWIHTKIAALEVEQDVFEGAIDVAQAAVDTLSKGLSGASSITIQADLDAKYASQATYNASELLVNTAINATKHLTQSISDLTEFVEKESASVFNLRSLTLSGTYSSATSTGSVKCHFQGVFFGHAMDTTFSLAIGSVVSAASTAQSLLSEAYHMIENKWLNSTDGSAPLPPPSPPMPSPPSPPPVYDRCNEFMSCSACSAAPRMDGTECGWCQLDDSEGMCASGAAGGPVSLGKCSDWRFGTCDAPAPPPPAPPSCPLGFNSNPCSNQGTCNTASWTCECNEGRKGNACEFSCPALSITNPSKDGHAVVDCKTKGLTANCKEDSSVGWVADQICQASSMGSKIYATHYENGHCDSSATLSYWTGGTCITHWYNFGDCQCTPVVNVLCANTGPGCT